ncbi:hypothetical protein ABK040_016749 [Willaertia magna]
MLNKIMKRQVGFMFIDLPELIKEKLQKLFQLIPNDVKLNSRGDKVDEPTQAFHSTLIGELPTKKKENINKLLDSYFKENNIKKFKARISSYSISKVERITKAKVYCLSLSLVLKSCQEDKNIVDIRKDCAKLTEGSIFYDENSFHISICYFDTNGMNLIESALKENNSELSQLLHEICDTEFEIEELVTKFNNKHYSFRLQ